MRTHRIRIARVLSLPFWVVFGWMPLGCSEDRGQVQQIAEEPEIGLLDIAGGTLPSKPNQYQLLTKERTKGRFPGALAVVRLAVSDGNSDGGVAAPVKIKPLSDQEGAYWNHLMDNIRWVREYFEIKPVEVPTATVRTPGLLDSANRLHASLCLVYGQSDKGSDRSRLVGVIYDPGSGSALATISAESAGADDWLLERPADRHEQDNRHQDNHYLAQRKFERLVHACVLDLVSLDQPKREQKPKGWEETTPATPLSGSASTSKSDLRE